MNKKHSLTDLFKSKSKEDIIRDLSKLSQNELNYKLINASRNGVTSVIQYLIDAGVDVNFKNEWGWTALMKASWNGHKDIVEILIGNGADVNAKSHSGWTPLMLASENGYKDIVELLKKHGAKETIKQNINESNIFKSKSKTQILNDLYDIIKHYSGSIFMTSESPYSLMYGTAEGYFHRIYRNNNYINGLYIKVHDDDNNKIESLMHDLKINYIKIGYHMHVINDYPIKEKLLIFKISEMIVFNKEIQFCYLKRYKNI